MTLLLALGNAEFCAVVADRRLSCDGVLRDDEANKVCALFCDDARLGVAFTGLAQWGLFRTEHWLAQELGVITKTVHNITNILERLRERAQVQFDALQLDSWSIDFMFAGFTYGADQPPTLSGYHLEGAKGRAFQVRTLPATVVLVDVAGSPGAVAKGDLLRLEEMLNERYRPPAVVNKAVVSIQGAAKSTASQGVIGQQCNSVIVQAAPDSPVVSTYHSARITTQAFGANVVVGTSIVHAIMMGVSIQSSGVLAGQPLNDREPCFCLSGKRYARCHGRHRGEVSVLMPWGRPPAVPWSVRALNNVDPPVFSGHHFCVKSAFD